MENKYVSIEGLHYLKNEPIKISIKNGLIVSIEQSESKDLKQYIGPGFVDLQINGFKGIDFNSLATSEEEIVQAVHELVKEGVTSFYPTIITNSYENIQVLVKKIAEAAEKYPLVNNTIAGIHLEGPFLSQEDGPRGAHEQRFIKAPEWEFFKELNVSVSGLIKLITLSPEWADAPGFIENAVRNNVVVSIGHTAADTIQIERAVEAGAGLSTHLGNGAHVTLPRHPNYIWDQLAQDGLAATVIADGFHLPANVLKVFEKVKGDRLVIVSDSVALAGLPPGNYKTEVGGEVTLTEQGKLHLVNEPRLLAGSAQSILWGVNQLAAMGITDLSRAIEKASILPAGLMDLPQQHGLTPGAPADLIFFIKENGRMHITDTMKTGEIVYTAN